MSIDLDTFRPLMRGRTTTYDYPTIRFYPKKRGMAYLNAVARDTGASDYYRYRLGESGYALLEPVEERGPDAYKLHTNGLLGCPRELYEQGMGQTFRLTPTKSGLLFDLGDPLPDF